MEEIELLKLTKITPDLLLELCEIESKLFGVGDARYTLPMFAQWGRFFLLKVEGTLAGGSQVIKSFDNPAEAYIFGFWVLPKYRSRGIGTSFLAKVIEQLKKERIEKIYLTVDPENLSAVSLYEKAGFVREKIIKDFYGKSEDRYLMVKHLGYAPT